MDSSEGDREFPPLTSYLFTVIMAVCMIVFFYLSFMRYRKRKYTARKKEAEYIEYVMLGRPGCSRSQLGITRARSLMTNTHFSGNASVWTMDDTFPDNPHMLGSSTSPSPILQPSISTAVPTQYKLATVPPEYTCEEKHPGNTVDKTDTHTDIDTDIDKQKATTLDTNADIHNVHSPKHPISKYPDVHANVKHPVENESSVRKNKSKKHKKWKHMKKKMQSDSKARERFENLIGAYRSLSLDITELNPINDTETNNDTSTRSSRPRPHSEPYLPSVEHEHIFYKRNTRLNTNTYYSDDYLPIPKVPDTRRKHRPLPQLDNVYFQNMNSRRWSEGSAHVKRIPKSKSTKRSSAESLETDSLDITEAPPMRRSMTMPETTILEMGDKTVYSSQL